MNRRIANKIIGSVKRGIDHNYSKQQISKANKILRRAEKC